MGGREFLVPPNKPLVIDHRKISIVNHGAVRIIVAVSNNAMRCVMGCRQV